MPVSTVKKPFVYDELTGKIRLLQPGEVLDDGADTLVQTVAAGGAVAAGAPVSTTGSDEVDETDATSATDACQYLGLSCNSGAAGADVGVVYQGPVTLPTGTWDALTGNVGGLVPGQQYWVDPASPGDLVDSPPTPTASVQYVIRVGHALNTTTMMVERPQPFAI